MAEFGGARFARVKKKKESRIESQKVKEVTQGPSDLESSVGWGLESGFSEFVTQVQGLAHILKVGMADACL